VRGREGRVHDKGEKRECKSCGREREMEVRGKK